MADEQYPPFAYSLCNRRDGLGVLAYKVIDGPAHGKATPLVLVHGLASTGLVDWLPLALGLAETRPVLFFDNRNMGKSVPSASSKNEAFSVQDMSNDLIELVQHAGWKNIDFLGFSMGGTIVQQLLVTPELPFKVNHVILCSTAAKTPESDLLPAATNPESKTPAVADWTSTIQTASTERDTLEEQIASLTPLIQSDYDPSFAADSKNAALIRRRVIDYLNTNRPELTINQQIQAVSTWDVRDQLAVIPAALPVLVVHGTADRSVYYTEHAFILEAIKHAQHIPFEGIGHMWYDYYTEAFWVNFINSFLNDEAVKVTGV